MREQHLVNSQAGMRFIAQMTIYNTGNFDRLLTFIRESYTPDLLAAEPAENFVAALRELYEDVGKLRVRQVIGTGKHHVLVLMEAQHSETLFIEEVIVEEDYPHRITHFSHQPAEDE